MSSIEFTYTYELERLDTPNFHGWVVFECSEGMKEEYYKDPSIENCRAVMRDLGAL